jgi:hypothetical protein
LGATVKSILDRSFRYVPASKTDLRKTFDRVRREQRANADEQRDKVKPLKQRAKA